MKITQELVDEIIKLAKNSDYGLSEGLTDKAGHNQIKQYPDDLNGLALLLVNGYDEKYDLISVFYAALQIIRKESLKSAK